MLRHRSEERHIIYSVSQGGSACSDTGQRRVTSSTASVKVGQHSTLRQVRGGGIHRQLIVKVGQEWRYSQKTACLGRPRVAVFTDNSLSR